MPQMAPLWWEILFIVFFMTYFIMNMMVYFIINPTPKSSMNNKKMESQMNWKW